ncbi:MAG: hypothetical protein ABJD11_01415 [Gemmatimonadota bacterium]
MPAPIAIDSIFAAPETAGSTLYLIPRGPLTGSQGLAFEIQPDGSLLQSGGAMATVPYGWRG